MSMRSEDSKNSSGIQVIGAGLGRTGTMSLCEALRILGYQPYHYVDVAHAPQWAAHAQEQIMDADDKKENDTESIDSIIHRIVDDGYTAVVENPCSDVYRDVLRLHPNAKVVLTVRDTPEKFEQSWKVLMDTMVVTEQEFSWNFPSFFGWIPLFRQLKIIRQFMGTTHLGLAPGALTHGWRDQPAGWLAAQYTRHNQDVQHHVFEQKPQNLLLFNVKDGWKPLCDFLGCALPQVPFPHVKTNDSQSLIRMRRVFLALVYSWMPILYAGVSTAVYYWYETTRRPPMKLSFSNKKWQ